MTAPSDPALGATAVDYDPFADAPLARVVPATESQREIWLAASLQAEASLAYNESVTLHLQGDLDAAALERALQGIVDRHEALRGSLAGDGLSFCIAAQARVPLARHDFSALQAQAREAALESALRASVETPFALDTAPLLRADLLRTAADEHILLLGTHHIVCDGWSFGIIVRELAALYRQETQGNKADLPAPDSFADFALAEAAHPQTVEFREDEAYWLARHAPLPPPLDLPLDRARPRHRGFASRRVDRVLESGLVDAVRRCGAGRGASLYATLLTAFGVLLHRLGGQDDLVVGIPAAGQAEGGHGCLVGHAVNVLPLRMSLDASAPFAETLRTVRGDLLDAFEHQRYTFGTLLRRLAVPRDPGRLPLVSVLFNLDAAIDDDSLGFEGLRARFAGVPRSYENFELFINAVQVGGGLRLECQYAAGLFDEVTIARWLDLYATLLGALVESPDAALAALPMLSADAEAALQGLQPAATAFDCRRIETLFFAQAGHTPDATAVQFGSTCWSYAELAARARRMANALRARGVGPGDRVGIALRRNPDMLTALLGVLASGAAYVPLDPAFPRERLDFMAADAGLVLLVCTSDQVGAIEFPRERCFAIDAADALAGIDDLREPVPSDEATEAAAYVIYTSGSTGQPKGVCVPHRAVANFLASMRREPGLDAHDRLLAVTTLSFDIAVLELFLPLTTGACVVLATREQCLDGRTLAELIHAERITVMQATPSTWRLLIEAGWSGRCGLKALCGGEPLPPGLAAVLIERCDALWNMYGPTETTVWSTCARIDDARSAISIGRPIDNTQVRILDALARPCPIGVPGEIAIGGAGLSLGYLDRPELNADRLIPDPQATDAQARVYRTGDRGRWRNDGRIEHLGRLDFQVKLRGFRIELGDVETNLMRHPDITQAVALVREDRPGDQRLVAYLAGSAREVDEGELRAHLRRLLPDYMIPQHFLRLDAIPLLPNGKIDRARLPAPNAVADRSSPAHVAPRNDTERRVAAAMESALSLPGIGVHDDFFALGGHSLLAARLTAQLGREFGLNLSLGMLFEFPSVAALAAAIEEQLAGPQEERAAPVTRLADPAMAPLSLLQKRLWLFEQLNPGTVVYNTPSAHRLRGNLDEEAFARAFSQLCARQAILRTTIERVGGEVVQRIHDIEPPGFFPAEDLSAFDAGERERRLLARLDALTDRAIDLERFPLYRTHMFRLAEDEHVFFFMPHHIIWDGWSFDLFYAEFAELYAACRERREAQLPGLPASYGEFAQWHTHWLQGSAYAKQFQRELAFWRERLTRVGAPTPLPTDRPRGRSMVGRGETEWIKVPAELSERLRTLGRRADATLFMTLLAAYYALLWRFVGSTNLVVGTPVRVRASSEVEQVMGLFTNLLPLPLEIDPGEDFLALVARVKAAVMQGFASPEVQLEDLMREPGMRELAGATHFYQAQFSYQDARERNCNWGGLVQEQVLVFQRAASEDLAIWFLEHGNGMTGGVLYNADLLECGTARLFASRYLDLLDRLAAAADASVAELTAATEADWSRVRDFAAQGPASHPTLRLEQGFEQEVDRHPARALLHCSGRTLSAIDVERSGNRIAACLRDRGVEPGSVVALCVEHAADALAGTLGILKAGAICLRLDAADSAARVTDLLGRSAAVHVLGHSRLEQALAWPRARCLFLDADAGEIDAAPEQRVASAADADAPAFLCAEPDSAGAGLRSVSHAALARLTGEFAERLGIANGDRLLGISLPGSAQGILECLLALRGGIEWMALRPGELADPARDLRMRLVSFAPRVLCADAEGWSRLAAADDRDLSAPRGVCIDAHFDDALLAHMRRLVDEAWLACAPIPSLPPLTLGPAPAADSATGCSAPALGWAGVRVLDAGQRMAACGSAGQLWLAAAVGGEACRDPIDGTPLHATGLRVRWMFDGRLHFIGAAQASDPPRLAVVASPTGGAAAATAAAMSDSERWLAGLWKDLLGIGEVAAADNFFDLGGHSLLAMTFVARVEEHTGVRLGLLKVANSSLRALAADVPAQAIADGPRQTQSLRERALRLFGFKREPEA
jgi:amino acid adenylation domain-containing protein